MVVAAQICARQGKWPAWVSEMTFAMKRQVTPQMPELAWYNGSGAFNGSLYMMFYLSECSLTWAVDPRDRSMHATSNSASEDQEAQNQAQIVAQSNSRERDRRKQEKGDIGMNRNTFELNKGIISHHSQPSVLLA
jgi:hypothetical protein